MSDEVSLGLLKTAIKDLKVVMQKQNKINNISIISNLLCAGIITLEEAQNDKDFKELYDRLHQEPDKTIIYAKKR